MSGTNGDEVDHNGNKIIHGIEDFLNLTPAGVFWNWSQGRTDRTHDAAADLSHDVGTLFPGVGQTVKKVEKGLDITAMLLLAGGAFVLYEFVTHAKQVGSGALTVAKFAL